jgi:alpha 1,3-glucosidase
MKKDPFTLRVALDKSNSATGELYLDDGDSFKYRDGEFIWRKFVAEASGKKKIILKNHDLGKVKPQEAIDPNVPSSLTTFDPKNAYAKSIEGAVRVEKIVVFGLASKPSSVKLAGSALAFDFVEGVAANGKKEGTASVLTVKDPKVDVGNEWEIEISL